MIIMVVSTYVSGGEKCNWSIENLFHYKSQCCWWKLIGLIMTTYQMYAICYSYRSSVHQNYHYNLMIHRIPKLLVCIFHEICTKIHHANRLFSLYKSRKENVFIFLWKLIFLWCQERFKLLHCSLHAKTSFWENIFKFNLLHSAESSSEPSPQSLSWSHCHLNGIHLLFLHLNWSGLHCASEKQSSRKN